MPETSNDSPQQQTGIHTSPPDRSSHSDRAQISQARHDVARAAGRWLRLEFTQTRWPSVLARAVGKVIIGLAALALLGSATFAAAMCWALYDLPPEKPIGGNDTPSLLLEAANGAPLGRIGPFKTAKAARSDFPNVLVNAVISVEDRRFYHHWGFDLEGIARAYQKNHAAGTIVEGGSTITQQLVKMRYLGHDRTMKHKLREALVAAWLDFRLGKEKVLTRYLNSVYLGNGAFGMPAGAKFYFDKQVRDLTLPEAAMLAGLIRAPSRDNPVQNPEAARNRAAVVIDTMRDNGKIDAKTAEEAKAHPATVHIAQQTQRAGTWFADWIAKQAAQVPGSFSGHMRLRTTLMPDLQKLAEQTVDDVLAREGAERHASQAALVAMRPDGAVVAMVGGRDYRTSQFNRAVDARRQPGSAFKLFVYLAALRHGHSPDDVIDAGSVDIKGWEPENYADRQYGRVTLADAFAHSINTAAVHLAQEAGLNQVVAAARDLGITDPLPLVPSLALGTADINLLDLTAAYAAVSAGKMPIKPWGIAGFGVEGQPVLQSMGPLIGATQSLQPYQKPLIELLEDVVQHGTGRAAALDGFAAGKTGTSQDYRNAWFIGFNDALVVGVWVGNDDSSPMDHVTGGSLPAEIWKRFITDATTAMTHDAQPPTTPAPSEPDKIEASADQGSNPKCDFQACARTYSSFRASDCTYQPYGESSRRVCERNASQRTTNTSQRTAMTPAAQDSESQGSQTFSSNQQCNVDACARTYSSFDPSTCTYQPYDGGPRRSCSK